MGLTRLPLTAILLTALSCVPSQAAPERAPIEVFRSVTVSAGARESVAVWRRIGDGGCWSSRTRMTGSGRTLDHSSFIADRGAGPQRVSQTLEGGRLSEYAGPSACDGDPPPVSAEVMMAAARSGRFRPVGVARWRGRVVAVARGPVTPFLSGWTASPHPPEITADGPAVVLRSPGGPVRVSVPRTVLTAGGVRTVVPPRVITLSRGVITGDAAERFSFALRAPRR